MGKGNIKINLILNILGFALLIVGGVIIRFAKDEIFSILGGIVIAIAVGLISISRYMAK